METRLDTLYLTIFYTLINKKSYQTSIICYEWSWLPKFHDPITSRLSLFEVQLMGVNHTKILSLSL